MDTATGLPVTRTINFNPGPVIPDFFSRTLAYDPNQFGPWTLNFVNGTDVTRRTLSLPAGTTQAPFVNSIALSGSSTNPAFAWSAPPGAQVNGYRINIHDRTLVAAGRSGLVVSRDLSPTITNYTVDGADFTVPGYAFMLDKPYSIEIAVLQTRDGGGNTNNFNLKAISRTYADFTARESGGPVVNLPVLRPDGVFEFNMTVQAGQTYYIDPVIAVGYDYAIGTGNPSFSAVTLPTGIGDGLYDLYGLEGGVPVLLQKDLAGGLRYSFAGGGITQFRVLGIEASAALDPANTTAFVTAVEFSADGVFTGTQTPLTAPVPEPSTWALFGLGLTAVVAVRRRLAA